MKFVNGYIYILWNDMYKLYGDNVFKLGRTTDIQKRINCYTTVYIRPSEIKYISIKCDNYVIADMLIFDLLRCSLIFSYVSSYYKCSYHISMFLLIMVLLFSVCSSYCSSLSILRRRLLIAMILRLFL